MHIQFSLHTAIVPNIHVTNLSTHSPLFVYNDNLFITYAHNYTATGLFQWWATDEREWQIIKLARESCRQQQQQMPPKPSWVRCQFCWMGPIRSGRHIYIYAADSCAMCMIRLLLWISYVYGKLPRYASDKSRGLPLQLWPIRPEKTKHWPNKTLEPNDCFILSYIASCAKNGGLER